MEQQPFPDDHFRVEKIYQVTILYSSGVGIADLQKWLRDHKIRHGPTRKDEHGWRLELYSAEDAMAVKLAWI